LTKPYSYEVKARKSEKETKVAKGADLKTANIHSSNLLIEIYCKTEAGHSGGILVEKLAEAGYSLTVNAMGGVTFAMQANAATRKELSGKTIVNDGKWHHIIAEADRSTKTLTVYIDGVQSAQGPGIGPDDISNSSDLFVGGSAAGRHLAGSIDFLRICQGTLADAQTSIGELYAWEFSGPQTKDFTGKSPVGPRDAGALEYTQP
jgi:hypothetical protein